MTNTTLKSGGKTKRLKDVQMLYTRFVRQDFTRPEWYLLPLNQRVGWYKLYKLSDKQTNRSYSMSEVEASSCDVRCVSTEKTGVA